MCSNTLPHSARLRHHRGFTLVELLLALFLFALVASVVFAAFSAIVHGVEKGRQSTELYRVGRTALARMAQEIGAALPEADSASATSTSTSTPVFMGKKDTGRKFPHDRIEFMTIPYRYYGVQTAAYESCRVAYYLADNAQGGLSLVRAEDCSGDTTEQREQVRLLELTDLAVGLAFTYYDAEQDYEEWPPVKSDAASPLPCRVRIALTLGATQQYERSFITVASLPMREPCEDERARSPQSGGAGSGG